MKVLLLLCITIATTASIPEHSNYDYHRRFGIPNALSIKEAEKSISASRIVGGSQSSLGTIAYVGGIVISLTNGLNSVCSSCLISNTRSLTAAHCWWDGVYQAWIFNLVYGSVTLFSGGTRLQTSNVTMHPYWNPNSTINNIAVIVHSHLVYTNNIQPIALPASNEQASTFAGFTGVASGYGRNYDGQQGVPNNQTLHYVSVPIITNSVCQASYGNAVQPSTMCTSGAANKGICGGDSGGPLAVWSNNRYILVGVASFYSGYCQAGYPSGYVRTTYHISWIMTRL